MAKLSDYQKMQIELQIKKLLIASRDCQVNLQELNVNNLDRFSISGTSGGYTLEAFGMLRTLAILGYGQFGAVNDATTMNYWFETLQNEVLTEECDELENPMDVVARSKRIKEMQCKYVTLVSKIIK